MGEGGKDALRVHFDARVRLEFHGATITSDAGLLACRELDDALGLTERATGYLLESRGRRNVQHELVPLLRQSVYSRLAGYEDTNDAERLARGPAMRVVTSRQASDKRAASTNTLSRFETEVLTRDENLAGLARLNAQWVERAMARTPHQRVILDMDSSESPVHGHQEDAAYNGHFESVCYHLLFCFNQFGDCEGAVLRPGNVHSADRWREVLDPIVERYARKGIRLLYRADAAFAKPEVYDDLEERAIGYAIRLPANDVLQEHARHLLKRPVGRPAKKPIVCYHEFVYQAGNWERPRRVMAKVEWHRGELFPRLGFIVTNLSLPAEGVVHFYNGRGTAEQWIKGGEVHPPLDAALLPPLRGQPGAPLLVHPGLQAGQLLAALSPAGGREGLVLAQPPGQAAQDRRPAGPPCQALSVPARRGGGAPGGVPGSAGAHREVMPGTGIAVAPAAG